MHHSVVAAGLCVLLPGLMFAMITDHHCEILYYWDQIWTSTGSIHGIGWVGLGCFVIVFFRFLCLKITRGWRVMNRTVLLQPDLWELKKELFGATVVLSRIRRRRTARLEAVSRTRSVAGTSHSKTGPVLQRKALQGMGIPWESHGNETPMEWLSNLEMETEGMKINIDGEGN